MGCRRYKPPRAIIYQTKQPVDIHALVVMYNRGTLGAYESDIDYHISPDRLIIYLPYNGGLSYIDDGGVARSMNIDGVISSRMADYTQPRIKKHLLDKLERKWLIERLT